MKTYYFKTISMLLLFMCSIHVYANKFEIDGLYYEMDVNSANSVIVVQGTVKYPLPQYTIPEKVTYENVTYTVTGIGKNAFY